MQTGVCFEEGIQAGLAIRGGDERLGGEHRIHYGFPCHLLSLTLQSKLSRNLSNFRAIDGLLSEAFSGLQVRTPWPPPVFLR